jgi:hypothetical protein
MKENKPFTHVGYLPEFDALVEKISVLTDKTWCEYKGRKNTSGVASYVTETIPLLYSPNAISAKNLIHHKYHQYLQVEINRMCIFVSNLVGDVKEKQSMLTRLGPGGLIKTHKDKGPITRQTHRVHLPIITNDRCTFTVGEVTMKLKPGDIWIIDNTDHFHSVENNGETPRIHLIVDMA